MISVIVPVYNVEKYLNRCVDSILKQTYQDIEIILVDDGSTDSSGTICDEYKKLDSRIKAVHINNSGAAKARNVGLDMVNGDYISFIDSDDWILPNFLENLFNLCNENNCDIAKCETIDVKNENFQIENVEKNVVVYSQREIINEIYRNQKLYNVAVMNKLYKKHIFSKLRFKEGIINEDEEILCKIILNSNKIAVTNEILYCYFLSNNSVTRSKFRKKNLDILIAFESRLNLLEKTQYIDVLKQAQADYMRNICNLYYNVSVSNWDDKNTYLQFLKEKRDNSINTIKKNKYYNIKDRIKYILCFYFKNILKILYMIKG